MLPGKLGDPAAPTVPGFVTVAAIAPPGELPAANSGVLAAAASAIVPPSTSVPGAVRSTPRPPLPVAGTVP